MSNLKSTIEQEFKDNPEFAVDLLSMAGNVGMAYLGVKIRNLHLEYEKMKADNGALRRENRQLRTELRSEVEGLSKKCAAFQSKVMDRFRELENHGK